MEDKYIAIIAKANYYENHDLMTRVLTKLQRKSEKTLVEWF